MKNKIIVCAVLTLSFVGIAGVSFAHFNHSTYKVADRAAT